MRQPSPEGHHSSLPGLGVMQIFARDIHSNQRSSSLIIWRQMFGFFLLFFLANSTLIVFFFLFLFYKMRRRSIVILWLKEVGWVWVGSHDGGARFNANSMDGWITPSVFDILTFIQNDCWLTCEWAHCRSCQIFVYFSLSAYLLLLVLMGRQCSFLNWKDNNNVPFIINY